MADTNTGNDGGSQGAAADAENKGGAADSQNNAGDDSGGDDGDGDKGDGAGAGDGKGDDSKKDDKKSDDKSQGGADDEEPQSRKSNAWWVAKRRGDKIEKITKKDGEGDGAGDGKGDDNKGGDDDFDSKLDAALEERLSPLKQQQLEKDVDNDIASVIADEPKFKPYAAKVRKWALHESRANVPVQSIFYEVAGKDLMKLGADKGKEADDEAKNSQGTGGGTESGDQGGAKSVWDMTPDEFAAEQLRIRSGGGQAQ